LIKIASAALLTRSDLSPLLRSIYWLRSSASTSAPDCCASEPRCCDGHKRTCLFRSQGPKKQTFVDATAICLALARRLAVIMHRIWIDGTAFRWTRHKLERSARKN
jgi:hypothetical protein